MIQEEITITNPTGLHLRPISLIVNKAKTFANCKITFEVDGEKADAKSAFSLQELDLDYKNKIKITCDGDGESELLAEVKKIIAESV